MTTSIPADFPREEPLAALTGAQPKLAVRFDAANRTYSSSIPSDELQARFVLCEDLAHQLAQKCTRNRSTKYAKMSENEILTSFLKKLNTTGWGSIAEMQWVIRRTAELLNWLAPASGYRHAELRTQILS
jgi:hypothetical protein